MRLKLLFGICVLLTSFQMFAQEEEEEFDELADIDIFYDTTEGFTINLGTDMVRIALGTPNISAAFELNERFVVDAQIGFLVFPYRAEFFGFETDLDGGMEFNLGVGGYLVRHNFMGKGSLYLGLEYENWNYNSSSFDVIRLYDIKNIIDENAIFSDNVYTLALDYGFKFKRTLTRYGFEAGVNYRLNEKVRMNFGLHLAFEQEAVTFDSENSFGVTWEPESVGFGENGEAVKRTGLAGLLSVTFKYHLF